MKKLVLLAAVSAMILGTALPALADATIVVVGQPKSIASQAIDFGTINLNGADHNAVVGSTTEWVANDPTGTGEGWHINMKATDFAHDQVSGSATAKASKIAIGGFRAQLADSSVNAKPGVTSAVPTSDMAALTTLATSDQSMLSAAIDEGMGKYGFTPNFELDVPASTYAGTYVSTVTVGIVAAP